MDLNNKVIDYDKIYFRKNLNWRTRTLISFHIILRLIPIVMKVTYEDIKTTCPHCRFIEKIILFMMNVQTEILFSPLQCTFQKKS